MRIVFKKSISLIILLFIFGLSLSSAALAQTPPPPTNPNSNTLLDGQEGIGDIKGVYGNPVDLRVTIMKIIGMVLGFLAIIFLILTLLAGFNYMTAAGNEEKVKKAVKQISQAVIGLIIVLSSWGISLLILRMIMSASKGYDGLYPL